MDWLDKKFLKNVVRLALLVLLVLITNWVYSYYEKEKLSYYKMQNQYNSYHPDSIRLANMRADADRLMNSMKRLHNEDSPSSLYTQVSPSPKQDDSLPSAPVTVQERNSIKRYDTHEKNTTALHGPTAIFSRECTIGIGKTIPVTFL